MSNLVVKMMSGELLPDENKAKGFTLVEAFGQVTCERNAEGKPRIEIPTEDGRLAAYFPEGNTYLIKNGKTVATFNYELYVESAPEFKIINQSLLDNSFLVITDADFDKIPLFANRVLVADELFNAKPSTSSIMYSKGFRLDEQFLHLELKKGFWLYSREPHHVHQYNPVKSPLKGDIFTLPLWVKTHLNACPLEGWYVKHDEIHWVLRPDPSWYIKNAKIYKTTIDIMPHELPKVIMLPMETLNELSTTDFMREDYTLIDYFVPVEGNERFAVFGLLKEFTT